MPEFTGVITQPGLLDAPIYRRFMANVDTSGGEDACHAWSGDHAKRGYGRFGIGGNVRVYAHRWILGYLRGRQLGRDEHALHRCDNPPCVNPLHLYVGDHAQNMRDALERGLIKMDGLALGRRPGKTLGAYRTGAELCGTVPGYNRHRRHGEETCQACREAANAYNRQRVEVRKNA